MKYSYLTVLLSGLIMSCSDDETSSIIESRYYIVNENDVERDGNISSFEYPSGNFIEHFFNEDTGNPTSVGPATINGDYMYMATFFPFPKLRKIDLTEGVEINSADSWVFIRPLVTSYKNDVIVGHAGLDNDYYIKRYDQNLILKDSIQILDVDYNFNRSKIIVVKDKLFIRLAMLDVGYVIKELDLETNILTDNIQVSSEHWRHIIQYSEKQYIIFEPEKFYILDLVTLQRSNVIETTLGESFDPRNITYNPSDNMLYFLNNRAQPSIRMHDLYKMDLSNGEITLIAGADRDDPNFRGPIIYDDKHNVLITGGNGIKVFSLEGAMLSQAESTFRTIDILK